MPSATSDIFTRQQVTRICKPSTIAQMHDALLNKPDATIGELVALKDALRFALAWTSGDEGVFFTFEESAKHCNAILNIADRHFSVK